MVLQNVGFFGSDPFFTADVDSRFIFSTIIMHGMIHSHIIIVLYQLLPQKIAIVDRNIDARIGELLTTDDVLFNNNNPNTFGSPLSDSTTGGIDSDR